MYRKRLNRLGLFLVTPYLLMMGVSFDVLFFGDKLGLKNIQKDLFKKPIDFQYSLIKDFGLESFLNNYLTFFQSYLLITVIFSFVIYNIGKVIGRKFFNIN